MNIVLLLLTKNSILYFEYAFLNMFCQLRGAERGGPERAQVQHGQRRCRHRCRYEGLRSGDQLRYVCVLMSYCTWSCIFVD